MRRKLLELFAACSAAALTAAISSAAVQPSIPLASEVRLRHQIYHGHGVTAFLLQIPPGQGSQMHRHDKDLLTIFISGGRTTAVFEGSAPRTDTLVAGTVRFRSAGFAHSTRNDGPADFRAVLLEFDRPQGSASQPTGPGEVLCTHGFCVRDVTINPGVRLAGPGVAFFVPVGDAIVREASGRRHVQRDGSIWRGRFGWSNGGSEVARVMVIDVH
jgi:quercetin dioxygenase-like cupin family protein